MLGGAEVITGGERPGRAFDLTGELAPGRALAAVVPQSTAATAATATSRDPTSRLRTNLMTSFLPSREKSSHIRLVTQLGDGPQPASSAQNSPKASTYRRISDSECCTDSVHCSSSPGVMKMPRFTIHDHDAANRSTLHSRKSR